MTAAARMRLRDATRSVERARARALRVARRRDGRDLPLAPPRPPGPIDDLIERFERMAQERAQDRKAEAFGSWADGKAEGEASAYRNAAALLGDLLDGLVGR
jgi:hypothetical protein